MRIFSYSLLCLLVCTFMISGCADISVPSAGQVLRDPLGTDLTPGMTKDSVMDRYGAPDAKQTVVSDEWSGTREEWFYKASISSLPVNAGHLSEDMYLYFDGDRLTNVSKKPLGRSDVAIDSDSEKYMK